MNYYCEIICCYKSSNLGGYDISRKLINKAKSFLEKEQGTIVKDAGGKLKVCIVYPNRYYLGMSNLGFQSIYKLFNDIGGCLCERAFLPEKEDLAEFERTNTKLFSLETQRPLKDFDIIAFSISFEEDYLNIPTILKLSDIPLLSEDRDYNEPFIMAGGAAPSLNPEPVANFFDFIFIGEAEDAIAPFYDLYARIMLRAKSKDCFYSVLKEMPGSYIPSLYEVDSDGELEAKDFSAPSYILKRKTVNIEHYVPESHIITSETEFKSTKLIEIERGCGRACRFCVAGFMYLPPRFRDKEVIKKSIVHGLKTTGKVGLVGPAVSEHPDLKEFLSLAKEYDGTITLSSLRLDVLDDELLESLKVSNYKTITIAPEAGTHRLRNVINKDITDEKIFSLVENARNKGFERIKLYYLIGLPTETMEDIEAIGTSALKLIETLQHKARGKVILSINPFIPKPFTPFQWHKMDDLKTLDTKIKLIKEITKKENGIEIKALSPKSAYLEALLSNSGREISSFIEEASRVGWKSALKNIDEGIKNKVFENREFDDSLPWDIIDAGIEKDYLWAEYEKSLKGIETEPCDVGSCFRCGVC